MHRSIYLLSPQSSPHYDIERPRIKVEPPPSEPRDSSPPSLLPNEDEMMDDDESKYCDVCDFADLPEFQVNFPNLFEGLVSIDTENNTLYSSNDSSFDGKHSKSIASPSLPSQIDPYDALITSHQMMIGDVEDTLIFGNVKVEQDSPSIALCQIDPNHFLGQGMISKMQHTLQTHIEMSPKSDVSDLNQQKSTKGWDFGLHVDSKQQPMESLHSGNELIQVSNLLEPVKVTAKKLRSKKVKDESFTLCEDEVKEKSNEKVSKKGKNVKTVKPPTGKKSKIIVDPERPFVCPGCHKGWKRKWNMQSHYESVHLGLTPFECEYCERKFTRQADVYRHQKSKRSCKK